MKILTQISASMVITVCLFFATDGQTRRSSTYIGAVICNKNCHNSDSIGNQFKAWQTSPHARAVRDLHGESAMQVAKKNSIDSPWASLKCLECHTTGRGSNLVTIDEGVGCEACHGPGSDYYLASNHVDFLDRGSAYSRAIKNGMYPILGLEDSHLKKREKLCMKCHNETRPCYPDDQTTRNNQKMTIQVIDKLIKGAIDLRHPIRK